MLSEANEMATALIESAARRVGDKWKAEEKQKITSPLAHQRLKKHITEKSF